ncbi:hypothetical protein FKM82_018988 [Ascaphus truei]
MAGSITHRSTSWGQVTAWTSSCRSKCLVIPHSLGNLHCSNPEAVAKLLAYEAFQDVFSKKQTKELPCHPGYITHAGIYNTMLL